MGLPYEKQYPEKYSFKNLARAGRLCYIPYGSYYADGIKMIEFGFQNELLKQVDYVFADCDKVYQFLNKKIGLCKNRDSKKIVYSLGYPRFDLVNRNNNKRNSCTYLWLPRWTTNSADNERSSFLEYKDVLLEYFSANKDLSLIVRPHPVMFENYVANGIMTAQEVNDYKTKIENLENVYMDEEPSYVEAFEKADCIIADYTSLVIEFLLSNKPVIYLGNTKNIDAEIRSAFFYCDSYESIIESVKKLHSGNDSTETSRLQVLENKKYQKGATIRILDALLY